MFRNNCGTPCRECTGNTRIFIFTWLHGRDSTLGSNQTFYRLSTVIGACLKPNFPNQTTNNKPNKSRHLQLHSFTMNWANTWYGSLGESNSNSSIRLFDSTGIDAARPWGARPSRIMWFYYASIGVKWGFHQFAIWGCTGKMFVCVFFFHVFFLWTKRMSLQPSYGPSYV